MPGVRLAAVAGYLPAKTLTNADLMASGLDTDDEWIVTRTGIRGRRVAAPDEGVIEMAVSASEKALAQAGIHGDAVDLVIVATATMQSPIPNAAGRVAARLGSKGAAFDLGAGCAGATYALAVAADLVKGGSATTAVVIGSDKLTEWTDYSDRSTAILFADGAGAFVVTTDSDPGRQDVGPVAWGSDGDQSDVIVAPEPDRLIRMQGQTVFRWATTKLAPLCRAACERAGVDVADLKGFVPHQANLRIVEGLANALGIDAARTPIARDVIEMGNNSAATVPIALANLIESRQVSPGDPVLLVAFGAGLSMAAQVIRCP